MAKIVDTLISCTCIIGMIICLFMLASCKDECSDEDTVYSHNEIVITEFGAFDRPVYICK